MVAPVERLPAIRVEYIADYLWWLLPQVLKRMERGDSILGALVGALGEQLDDSRADAQSLREQFSPASADAAHLTFLGRERGVYRLPGESDSDFRARIAGALETKTAVGTPAGLVAGLEVLGFTVAVIELFPSDPARWSEFVCRVTAWAALFPQAEFQRALSRLKPAHTRPRIESAVPMATFDDGGRFDEIDGEMDDGRFDAWALP